MSQPFVGQVIAVGVQFRAQVGRFARVSCYRSLRTRCCSTSSAQPLAATARRPSVCQTFGGAPRLAWAVDPD